MKTLFLKELRQNFRVALIGLAIATLVVTWSIHSSLHYIHHFGTAMASGDNKLLQPLLSPQLLQELVVVCAVFGGLVGWIQSRNEAHPDLWAFLIHRPVTRTQIFWAKASAGMCLYFLGVGLPLLGTILFVSVPGNIAAPFEWAMALPIFVIFLSGITAYFAGQLTGLRQAKWFGSRAFGLGAPLGACIMAGTAERFWQAFGGVAVFAVILATTVWGPIRVAAFIRGSRSWARQLSRLHFCWALSQFWASWSGYVKYLYHLITPITGVVIK